MDQLADVPYLEVAAGAAGVVVLALFLWIARKLFASRRSHNVLARVVAKRTSTYGTVSRSSAGQVYTAYFVTFELNSGERLEFHLPDTDYGLIVEGDEGTLSYQGTRWHRFERRQQAKGSGRRRVARARRA